MNIHDHVASNHGHLNLHDRSSAHRAFDAGLVFGDDFEVGDTGEWDGVFP